MSNTLPILISYEADGDWKVEFPTIGVSGKTRWFDGELSLDEVRQIATNTYYSLKAAC